MATRNDRQIDDDERVNKQVLLVGIITLTLGRFRHTSQSFLVVWNFVVNSTTGLARRGSKAIQG